jgi:hypothetical protein
VAFVVAVAAALQLLLLFLFVIPEGNLLLSLLLQLQLLLSLLLFVLAVILNAVKDPEELHSPQPLEPFSPYPCVGFQTPTTFTASLRQSH